MTAYLIRRLATSIIIVFLVTLILFAAVRFLPGDPIVTLMVKQNADTYSEEQIQQLREQYGLNRPVASQYVHWIGNVFQGDFGSSITYSVPVTTLLKQRIPISFYLGLMSFILANVIGVTLGVICAVKRGTWLDNFLTILANLGITLPVFWLGIMMIYIFAVHLRWLPSMGFTSPFENFTQSMKQIIMPMICLAIFPIASATRQARSSILEIMHQDYIRTAWSKGLAERAVITRHALKNGLIPVITLAGMGIASIIGGEVLVEQVFNIPGMGRLAVNSVMNLDYPSAQAVFLIIAIVVVVANMLVDISYGWLDPRIRYQ
jgi:peptide/nickel transport system permease protein